MKISRDWKVALLDFRKTLDSINQVLKSSLLKFQIFDWSDNLLFFQTFHYICNLKNRVSVLSLYRVQTYVTVFWQLFIYKIVLDVGFLQTTLLLFQFKKELIPKENAVAKYLDTWGSSEIWRFVSSSFFPPKVDIIVSLQVNVLGKSRQLFQN